MNNVQSFQNKPQPYLHPSFLPKLSFKMPRQLLFAIATASLYSLARSQQMQATAVIRSIPMITTIAEPHFEGEFSNEEFALESSDNNNEGILTNNIHGLMLISQDDNQDNVEAEGAEDNNKGVLTNNIHGGPGLISQNDNQENVEGSLIAAEEEIEMVTATNAAANPAQLSNNATQHHDQNCTMNMLRRHDQRGHSLDRHHHQQRQHRERNNATHFHRLNITEKNNFNSSHTFNCTRNHEDARTNGHLNENRRTESIRKPWRRV